MVSQKITNYHTVPRKKCLDTTIQYNKHDIQACTMLSSCYTRRIQVCSGSGQRGRPGVCVGIKFFPRVFASVDEQESAKELIQTSLNDWLDKSEEAVRSKNQQVEDVREKQMESLLDEMKILSSKVQKMEKLKKKELDTVPSKSSKSGSKSRSGVLSSTTFKSELKQKVRNTLGSLSDSSDSSRPASPTGHDRDGASGHPSPRSRVYFRPSSMDRSKSTVSSEGKISSTLTEDISAPETPIEEEFGHSQDFLPVDEPDSSEVMKSHQINVPKKSRQLATESSNIVSPESKIPATRPPSPPPPPKNVKLPPPRNLIY